MRLLPQKLKILDVDYPIIYFVGPLEVDLEGKEELASQWDMQDDTVRIHRGGRSYKAITQSLWTMAIEIIKTKLDIKFESDRVIRLLAVGLNTVMFYIGDAEGLADEEEGKGVKLGDEKEGKK